MARLDRLGEFFALDDDWVRPGGTVSRGDALFTLAVVAASLFVLELMRALAVGVVTWGTAGHILYFVAMSAVGIWFTSRRLGALFLR